MGSYLTFPVSGTSVEIAAVSTISVIGIWLTSLLVLLVLILLIVCAQKQKKRRARRRAEQHAAVEQAERIMRSTRPAVPTAAEAPVPAVIAAESAAAPDTFRKCRNTLFCTFLR